MRICKICGEELSKIRGIRHLCANTDSPKPDLESIERDLHLHLPEGPYIGCDVADDSELIEVGDAVVLTGNYRVKITGKDFRPIFGRVTMLGNGRRVTVQVQGICVFDYEGPTPRVNGRDGIEPSPTIGGLVAATTSGCGRGINLAVDKENKKVHVLL